MNVRTRVRTIPIITAIIAIIIIRIGRKTHVGTGIGTTISRIGIRNGDFFIAGGKDQQEGGD